MPMTTFAHALQMDQSDPLAGFRDEFHIPRDASGNELVYLAGNSLGLQPKQTAAYLERELAVWRDKAVRGHFTGDFPWMPYHEFLAEGMAQLVGGLPEEVVVMNSLTVNLHLMLTTFWQPRGRKRKVLLEAGAFPSDYIAVESHVRARGFAPEETMLLAKPRSGATCLDMDDLCQLIDDHRDELALVVLPGVHYYTGQVLDMPRLVEQCHAWDIAVGFDLAHAAGNIELFLHDWNVDFAVWCTYKYLNSGPGSVGGCFVHQRHAHRTDLPRLAGWWGHDKETRFFMRTEFHPIPTAEGWQLSNPPILSLAAIRASLDVFRRAGWMKPLVAKSRRLNEFFQHRIAQRLAQHIEIVNPRAAGCQMSLRVVSPLVDGRRVKRQLDESGFETDWREPDVIRAAPVPLYNRFTDIDRFVSQLEAIFADSTH